jgi:signal transduction histidine kinase
MTWQRWITVAALLLAFVALATWQWDEFKRERQLVRETVLQQADSVTNALVGGIRSHRRLGAFFADNVQSVLDELAKSKDVLAVGIASEGGQVLLKAGQPDQFELQSPVTAGESWDAAGFQRISLFRLPEQMGGAGSGRGAGGGHGRGGGAGGGRGLGPPWLRRTETSKESEDTAAAKGEEGAGAAKPSVADQFVAGKQYAAVLLLDRTTADRHIRQAARTRGSIVAAGGLLLLCVAVVWRMTVRLADARGRSRILEAEARQLRDLSRAAAGLAHETRNPLGLIRGWMQRLADGEGTSTDVRQQARAVIEECDRVTARINQFLAFARPSQPQTERFDPASVLEELAVLLEPDLEAKHLAFHRFSPGSTIEADREMLRQALFNLLQNAIQASPEGGRVEVSLRPGRNGQLRMEVADCGPGVSPENAQTLFTPYFTTKPGGTGLGLAIVRHIAAVHGWQTGYSPRPGGGAIFWLEGIHG